MTEVIEAEVQTTPAVEGRASAWAGSGTQRGTGSKGSRRALRAGGRATEAALEAVPIPSRAVGNEADKAENGPAEEAQEVETTAAAAWAVAVAESESKLS